MADFDSYPLSRFFVFFGLLFIAGLALLPAMIWGPSMGHSLGNNLVWLSSFDAGIWRGEIYPRWLPELWFGAGAPDFFFYGPLPFWISSTVGRAMCWQCDVPSLLNVGTLIVLAASGFGYYLFASRLLAHDKAFIAAGLYMILPYHLMVDLGVRQAFGELTAFAAFPFICYFLIGLFRSDRGNGTGLAVSVAALILSHLPSVIICAFVLGPITLAYGFAKSKTRSEAVHFLSYAAAFAVFGLGLSALYWLPAFVLLPDVASHTLWQAAFNWSNWLFFDGLAEPNPPMTMLLKVWLVAITALMLVFVKRLWENRDIALWCLLPLLVAWIFMTPLSWPLWKVLPFLQAIQFPWRFMMVAEFGLPLAIAFLLPKLRMISLVGTLAIMSLLSGFAGYQLGNIMGLSRQSVAENITDHLSAWEYLPKTAFDPIMRLTGGSRDAARSDWASNPGEISQTGMTMLSSRHWVADVDVDAPTQIVFRQFYWKLWAAHSEVTGQEIKLSAEPKFGLITFDVPAGKSKIKLDLEMDWSEKFGLALSFFSGSILVLIGLWRLRRREQ